jgi:hypothetical protein
MTHRATLASIRPKANGDRGRPGWNELRGNRHPELVLRRLHPRWRGPADQADEPSVLATHHLLRIQRPVWEAEEFHALDADPASGRSLLRLPDGGQRRRPGA